MNISPENTTKYIDLIIYNDDPNSIPTILRVNQRLWDYHQYIKEDDEKLSLCLYCYVRDTKKRFPEAEKYIKLDPYWAYCYSKHFIKGKWPEAEEYIKKDPEWAYNYANWVIKGRCLEIEEYIKKDPKWALRYVCDIIKDRWPEAENVLKTNLECWNYYQWLIKFNFPNKTF